LSFLTGGNTSNLLLRIGERCLPFTGKAKWPLVELILRRADARSLDTWIVFIVAADGHELAAK
jgi:hypothetical protein